MAEYVYVLSNPSFPSIFKIGVSNKPFQRAQNLYRTGVPTPFKIEYLLKTKNPKKTEKLLHAYLSNKSVNPNREFFKLDPTRIELLLELIEGELVDPQELKNSMNSEEKHEFEETENELKKSEENTIRPNITFNMLGIEEGQTLRWYKDEDVTCETVGNINKVRNVQKTSHNHNHEMIEEQPISLSKAAQLVLEHEKGPISYKLSGSKYWTYDGKTLSELRDERDTKQNNEDSLNE